MTVKPFKFQTRKEGNKSNWTDEEARYLLANHKCMFIENIADKLGRTVSATKNKASRMMLSITSKPKVSTK